MTKASDLFIECLEAEGCEYVFGIPGEENLDFLDSLSRSKENQAGADPPRAGRWLHGLCLRSSDRQDRRLRFNAWPWRHELHHCRRLCSARRHADDDGHRSETCEKIQARAASRSSTLSR